MEISFGRTLLSDFTGAVRREWVVPNGIGGYSSSTALGANTRKYHGLLVSSAGRLLLSKLEEELISGNSTFKLSTNEYPGTIYPDGSKYLDSFEFSGFPTFSYSFPGASVRKTVFPIRLMDAVSIDYFVHSASPARMRVFPLVNSRDLRSTSPACSIRFSQAPGPNFTSLDSGLLLCSDRANYFPSSLPEQERWYRSMLYREDRARGEDFSDSHYCPGSFELSLPAGGSFFRLVCGCGIPLEKLSLLSRDSGLLHRELQRVWRMRKYDNDLVDALFVAADSFLVHSGRGKAILAGYHWFSEWGRDALISLPGICLATSRFADAKSILLRISRFCRNGLIPNTFSPPAYNSVDASLWFVHAVYQYYRYTKDLHFAGRMLETIEQILHAYSKGIGLSAIGIGSKGFAVRMDSDSLLSCGTPDTQLTWMDAKENGKPVTPRNGKPVEINALWYNALNIACELSEHVGLDSEEYQMLAESVKKGFQRFWNPKEDCLFDVLDPIDPSVRPNQVFALSLPFRLLEPAKERAVLEKVRAELLTPYGMRSLSPKDSKYVPRYCPKNERAYHNGAVWPYLLGPFITAHLRLYGSSPETKRYAQSLLLPFQDHMRERGLGCISEVFDGNAPHSPGGCISQAWNVAELLRVCLEEKLFA